MKKLILIALAFMMVMVIPSASAWEATGTIRIGPDVWPVMVTSPADFEIWVQPGGSPTKDPHILLVMTEDSWNGLTGNVVVSWSVGTVEFAEGDFDDITDNSKYVPLSGTTEGARYRVSALKDHLSYGLSVPLSPTDTIYWAMKPFLSGDLTTTHQSFTVTLPSTHARMLVYALGKTGCSKIFNNRVPPTCPGFVVPELGPMLLALTSFSAFALYSVKRKKLHP